MINWREKSNDQKALRKRIADLEHGMKEISYWTQEDQDDHRTCAMQWRGCVAIARELLKSNKKIKKRTVGVLARCKRCGEFVCECDVHNRGEYWGKLRRKVEALENLIKQKRLLGSMTCDYCAWYRLGECLGFSEIGDLGTCDFSLDKAKIDELLAGER